MFKTAKNKTAKIAKGHNSRQNLTEFAQKLIR